jgi:hypothetical protein
MCDSQRLFRKCCILALGFALSQTVVALSWYDVNALPPAAAVTVWIRYFRRYSFQDAPGNVFRALTMLLSKVHF